MTQRDPLLPKTATRKGHSWALLASFSLLFAGLCFGPSMMRNVSDPELSVGEQAVGEVLAELVPDSCPMPYPDSELTANGVEVLDPVCSHCGAVTPDPSTFFDPTAAGSGDPVDVESAVASGASRRLLSSFDTDPETGIKLFTWGVCEFQGLTGAPELNGVQGFWDGSKTGEGANMRWSIKVKDESIKRVKRPNFKTVAKPMPAINDVVMLTGLTGAGLASENGRLGNLIGSRWSKSGKDRPQAIIKLWAGADGSRWPEEQLVAMDVNHFTKDATVIGTNYYVEIKGHATAALNGIRAKTTAVSGDDVTVAYWDATAMDYTTANVKQVNLEIKPTPATDVAAVTYQTLPSTSVPYIFLRMQRQDLDQAMKTAVFNQLSKRETLDPTNLLLVPKAGDIWILGQGMGGVSECMQGMSTEMRHHSVGPAEWATIISAHPAVVGGYGWSRVVFISCHGATTAKKFSQLNKDILAVGFEYQVAFKTVTMDGLIGLQNPPELSLTWEDTSTQYSHLDKTAMYCNGNQITTAKDATCP